MVCCLFFHISFSFLGCRLQPALPVEGWGWGEGGVKRGCWWFLIPTWVPSQMTLLAWCQSEANREQRHALDKRWIPSEREGGNREERQPAHLKCLSKFLWKKKNRNKKKATAKSELFTAAYKYISETLKDIIRHFHSPCLLCSGWGGKQKGSKHICISESLVPGELLWAVSANLFSAFAYSPPATARPSSSPPPCWCLVRYSLTASWVM